MSPFDFRLNTRIVFGENASDETGALARELGGSRAFVVTTPGIVAAGHVERIERSLTAAGVEVHRFEEVPENPTSADVDACRAALGGFPADVLIGLGGGSPIDVAKGCNFVRAGGGRMEDYWGAGRAKGDLLPLIAIPTTAGTGTEVQSFALIEQDGTHQKMACGDPSAAPKIALLDPTLTVTMPPFVTACTGLDTIAHAVEAAVTKKRNVASGLFARQAFVLAQHHLPAVLEDPENLAARGGMLTAAALGGLAIETSMLGAAHSMANPLTARYEIAHGQAVGLTLPAVVRYNSGEPGAAAIYAELVQAAGLDGTADSAALLARLDELLDAAGFERRLASYGVAESALEELAAEAAEQWTAQFNPRPVGAVEFRRLYAELLG